MPTPSTPSNTDISAFTHVRALRVRVAELRKQAAIQLYVDESAAHGQPQNAAQSLLFAVRAATDLAAAESLLRAVEESPDFQDAIARAEPHMRKLESAANAADDAQRTLDEKRSAAEILIREKREAALSALESDPEVIAARKVISA